LYIKNTKGVYYIYYNLSSPLCKYDVFLCLNQIGFKGYKLNEECYRHLFIHSFFSFEHSRCIKSPSFSSVCLLPDSTGWMVKFQHFFCFILDFLTHYYSHKKIWSTFFILLVLPSLQWKQTQTPPMEVSILEHPFYCIVVVVLNLMASSTG
jgi:hypothetical protein